MYGRGEDVFYYVTIYNENYPMPAKPDGVDEGIVRGIYRLAPAPEIGGGTKGRVRLVGSGAILGQVVEARTLLAERFGIAAEVYSATSWQQLRADALAAERWNRLHPTDGPRVSYVARVLGPDGGPVVVASDWVKALPDLVGRWLPAGYVTLGTEGFGRSDTREALRALFEIDAPNVALAALSALAARGEIAPTAVADAIRELGIDPDKADPLAL
jgi:pyruvate dehydrogenase E1 component